ncbi:hypothetical protein [Chelatococcus reniformis]|uniref:Uncharacterized protein n=1 Tax=Chelatococcus reniformis TaxID=1494448 RepID=A0A916XQ77_9HYPH|nr:hypothetical protein [Chelatococcus reniformis]GGC91580.1 hypothetical protein GCM10010994_56690 [Chelatococcus reniformis]
MTRAIRRVLIVEDVPSLAETYAPYLATEPVETTVAHTGAAARDVSPSTLYRIQAWQDAAQQPTYL